MTQRMNSRSSTAYFQFLPGQCAPCRYHHPAQEIRSIQIHCRFSFVKFKIFRTPATRYSAQRASVSRISLFNGAYAIEAGLSLHAWPCVSKRGGHESVLRYMRQALMGFSIIRTQGDVRRPASLTILTRRGMASAGIPRQY